MSFGKTVNYTALDSKVQDLITKAVAARELAYCPYSKFQVGAALLSKDGEIYTGCNVENAAYGISVCAEQTAIVKAVSNGCRQYTIIAITADNEGMFVSPCGACRQFIAEFGPEISVYLAKPDLSKVLITSISELLPLNFKFST